MVYSSPCSPAAPSARRGCIASFLYNLVATKYTRRLSGQFPLTSVVSGARLCWIYNTHAISLLLLMHRILFQIPPIPHYQRIGENRKKNSKKNSRHLLVTQDLWKKKFLKKIFRKNSSKKTHAISWWTGSPWGCPCIATVKTKIVSQILLAWSWFFVCKYSRHVLVGSGAQDLYEGVLVGPNAVHGVLEVLTQENRGWFHHGEDDALEGTAQLALQVLDQVLREQNIN